MHQYDGVGENSIDHQGSGTDGTPAAMSVAAAPTGQPAGDSAGPEAAVTAASGVVVAIRMYETRSLASSA